MNSDFFTLSAELRKRNARMRYRLKQLANDHEISDDAIARQSDTIDLIEAFLNSADTTVDRLMNKCFNMRVDHLLPTNNCSIYSKPLIPAPAPRPLVSISIKSMIEKYGYPKALSL